MTHACMGPYTSERSNMRTKYSRFLTADSQGTYAVSFQRKRVEFRARITSTSLALGKTEIGFGEIRLADGPRSTTLLQSCFLNSRVTHYNYRITTHLTYRKLILEVWIN